MAKKTYDLLFKLLLIGVSEASSKSPLNNWHEQNNSKWVSFFLYLRTLVLAKPAFSSDSAMTRLLPRSFPQSVSESRENLVVHKIWVEISDRVESLCPTQSRPASHSGESHNNIVLISIGNASSIKNSRKANLCEEEVLMFNVNHHLVMTVACVWVCACL